MTGGTSRALPESKAASGAQRKNENADVPKLMPVQLRTSVRLASRSTAQQQMSEMIHSIEQVFERDRAEVLSSIRDLKTEKDQLTNLLHALQARLDTDKADMSQTNSAILEVLTKMQTIEKVSIALEILSCFAGQNYVI